MTMDFSKYENDVPYPHRNDYTTVHVYKGGEVLGSYNQSCLKKVPDGAVTEKVFDEAGYRVAVSKHNARQVELEQQFMLDAFTELGLQSNPFARRLYAIAWERGHSCGYSEVLSILADLAELDAVAREVYGN
jgi:hypothetical protein